MCCRDCFEITFVEGVWLLEPDGIYSLQSTSTRFWTLERFYGLCIVIKLEPLVIFLVRMLDDTSFVVPFVFPQVFPKNDTSNASFRRHVDLGPSSASTTVTHPTHWTYETIRETRVRQS